MALVHGDRPLGYGSLSRGRLGVRTGSSELSLTCPCPTSGGRHAVLLLPGRTCTSLTRSGDANTRGPGLADAGQAAGYTPTAFRVAWPPRPGSLTEPRSHGGGAWAWFDKTQVSPRAGLLGASRDGDKHAEFRAFAIDALDQRQTRTGTVLCVRTLTVWLPKNRRLRPRLPCEAITMRSQFLAFATCRIPSAGN